MEYIKNADIPPNYRVFITRFQASRIKTLSSFMAGKNKLIPTTLSFIAGPSFHVVVFRGNEQLKDFWAGTGFNNPRRLAQKIIEKDISRISKKQEVSL